MKARLKRNVRVGEIAFLSKNTVRDVVDCISNDFDNITHVELRLEPSDIVHQRGISTVSGINARDVQLIFD